MAGETPKHDWYQTETHVVINILAKNTKGDDLDVNCKDKKLTVKFISAEGESQLFEVNLAHNVDENLCVYRTFSTKIEIKLQKCDGNRWSSLQCTTQPSKASSASDTGPPKYPSSSSKAKDWEKVEAEIAKAEEENAGKGDGEAALNELFQKIYSQGSDEVKKAMNKSFSESGGTVLSTNWSEIERDKTTVRAPDGMEWKQWDS